jgi:hypothetical protein
MNCSRRFRKLRRSRGSEAKSERFRGFDSPGCGRTNGCQGVDCGGIKEREEMNRAKIQSLLVGIGGVVFMSTALYFFRFRLGFFKTAIAALIIYYLLAWSFGLFKIPKSN